MGNRSFAKYVDVDPVPVESIPPRKPLGSPGRNKAPEYVALQSKLALRPDVDHKIVVLPAKTAREKKAARTVANSLRSTLRRYHITLTERTIGDELTIFARYTNGTTPE